MADGVVSKDELKLWLADCYSVEFTDKSDAFTGFRPIWCAAIPATG